MKSTDYEPVGMAPERQGYLANARGEPRTPPDWHRTHRLKAWRDAWLRGWDEREAWKNTPPMERGK